MCRGRRGKLYSEMNGMSYFCVVTYYTEPTNITQQGLEINAET